MYKKFIKSDFILWQSFDKDLSNIGLNFYIPETNDKKSLQDYEIFVIKFSDYELLKKNNIFLIFLE